MSVNTINTESEGARRAGWTTIERKRRLSKALLFLALLYISPNLLLRLSFFLSSVVLSQISIVTLFLTLSLSLHFHSFATALSTSSVPSLLQLLVSMRRDVTATQPIRCCCRGRTERLSRGKKEGVERGGGRVSCVVCSAWWELV